MLAPEIGCVGGIDVATQAHVVCALEAPSGVMRHQPSRLEASAQGGAQVRAGLQSWGPPETLLLGLEATGPVWEPLSDRLTPAGYPVLLLNPPQTASWAARLGRRAKCPTRWAGGADAGARAGGGTGTGQVPAV